jgi:para-aminobenzoate synthetase/4-amino-4-deoxychorismate lyase
MHSGPADGEVAVMADQNGDAIFALLDDSDSTAASRSSRLYTGFVRERASCDPAALDVLCNEVDAELRSGLVAVVLGDYEFGRNLQFGSGGHRSTASQTTQHGSHAALRFLLFSRCETLSRDEVDAWLMQREAGARTPAPAGIARLQADVDRTQFAQAIDAVHEALRAGESYQVNYTYRLHFDVFGTPLALYRRLRERQRVRYGALIALPEDRWVLSCSPELFVEKRGATLRARPMKGTVARSAEPVEDQRAADFLAHDPKNRAENVMIVDLLRNDLSRVARTGSVHVPALFSVEPYASVWQMTSTIEAALPERSSFADVMRALFPCGSITGAPKHRTMQLIDELEQAPRGLYTGAIGWLDAAESGAACGDFCLSVAIRTLMLDAADAGGMRRGVMGVGAGIVLDSVAADEYDECRLKARFLTEADPGIELFETMYATRADGVRHLDRHLARLAASAAWFGFNWDEAALRERLTAQCTELPGDGTPYRLRVALAKSGAVQLTAAPLAPLLQGPVGLLLAPDHGFANVHSDDSLLLHKTTRRAEFDRGWREAEARGGFDMLFFNERGELTEGGRSSVFVKLDGKWWTPPLASGLLPGVTRGVLLEAPSLDAAERVLTRADVLNAQALLICNALRGALPARLI